MQDWSLVLISILLLGVNVAQFVYWAKRQNDLLDRLMAKNNAEYFQVKNFDKVVASKTTNSKELEQLDQKSNDQVLSELNGMLGLR